jgi:hypothetical protein
VTKKLLLAGGLAACLLAVLGASATADPFEPAFQIAEVKGDCTVKTPTGNQFVPAEANRAYPYGTIIKTGAKGGCVLFFSAGNQAEVGPNASLVVGEDSVDAAHKFISLESGSVTLKLVAEDVGAKGFDVRTPVGVVTSSGGELTVDVTADQDLDVATIKVGEGTAVVVGPNYKVPTLEKGDGIVISTARDQSFTRIKTSDGEFDMEFRDAQGDAKTVSTKTGSVIKIWRRRSENGKMLIVTVLITQDGELVEAITTTEEIVPGTDVAGTKPPAPPPPPPPPGGPQPPPGELGEPLVLEVRATTTTTTSTTIPSPTPVGRR